MRKERIDEINKYIDELRTLGFSKLNQESSFLKIETYECLLNNGQVITREKLLKGGIDGSAAIVLAMTTDKKFLLSIEPRVFTHKTVDIGLPAGYIEKDEEPSKAARRELLEETGYEVGELTLLGSYYQDQGISAAYNHYYLATNCRKVQEQSLDDGEYIKYIQVDYDELLWLINNGYIKGLNSIYAIEKGKEYIKEMERK